MDEIDVKTMWGDPPEEPDARECWRTCRNRSLCSHHHALHDADMEEYVWDWCGCDACEWREVR